MQKAIFDEVPLSDKRVVLRADFNVPMDGDRIVDDRRIQAALPTLAKLIASGARTTVVSHRGRPRGKVDSQLRLAPIAQRLSELLQVAVPCASDVAGDSARIVVAEIPQGGVGMLENVRFEPGEEANDPIFAQRLAAFGDLYINDAFGTAHRAHASTEGITHFLPAYAGYLMAAEIAALTKALHNPERPLLAVIGGAKISTKFAVLQSLLPIVDDLWVGGAMASTFIRANGGHTGRSLVEDEQLEAARQLLNDAYGNKIHLPLDVVGVVQAAEGAAQEIVAASEVPENLMAVDVGPHTVAAMTEAFAGAKTVVWNGPLGLYEIPEFARGTQAVGRALANSPAYSIIGGGDLVAALEENGVAAKMSFVSTGGGATLEFLEGRTLPGIAALRDHVMAVP